MSEFIVHSIPGSPYGRAVLVTLEEKRARYRFSPIAAGTFRSEQHLARHPFGKVPVLEHGDFKLYETQAILRYLDRVLPTLPLTPADPRDAGRMDQAMNLNDWYLFNGVSSVIGFQRLVGPRLMGLTPDEAAIAEVMPKAEAVFAEIERLLSDRPYFAGTEVSLADTLLGPHVDFFVETPEWAILSASRPSLVAWLARMNVRQSMVETTWPKVAELAKAA